VWSITSIRGMSEEAPGEWQIIFGAKVKTPVDMPDDILKDAITITINELNMHAGNFDTNDMIAKTIKEYMDKTWEPQWHVTIGRNFGSKITHETRRFLYFYINDRAVMIYKAG